MRKLAFRYRRIKEIYNTYRTNTQSTDAKNEKFDFRIDSFLSIRFTWSTKIRRITSITCGYRIIDWFLADISN